MADKPKPSEATPKRRVRNPETFRQRAIKAAEQQGKPQKRQRVSTVANKVTGPVVRPVAQAGRAVGSSKPFKPVRFIGRILGKILVPPYVRNSWKELRQVTWLSFKQSLRLTWAVLIFAIVFGVVIAGIDWGLDKIFRNILLR